MGISIVFDIISLGEEFVVVSTNKGIIKVSLSGEFEKKVFFYSKNFKIF